jgi:hypothetical protein
MAFQKEIGEKLGYRNLMSLCHEKRLYVKDISKAERAKHDSVLALHAVTSFICWVRYFVAWLILIVVVVIVGLKDMHGITATAK